MNNTGILITNSQIVIMRRQQKTHLQQNKFNKKNN